MASTFAPLAPLPFGSIGTTLRFEGQIQSQPINLMGFTYDDPSTTSVEGDVNADGVPDLMVAGGGRPDTLLFGSNGALDGSTGAIPAVSVGTGLEFSNFTTFQDFGDINGDGIDDLLFGRGLAGPIGSSGTGAGRVYVVFGDSDLDTITSLDAATSLDGVTAVEIIAPDTAAKEALPTTTGLGSVVLAGDLDGDGIKDLIIMAESDGEITLVDDGEGGLEQGIDGRGRVFIVWGNDDTTPTGRLGKNGLIDLGTLGASELLTLEGDIGRGFVNQMAILGDVNGDGFTDLGIAEGQQDNSGSGQFSVVFGGPNLKGLDVQTLSSLSTAAPAPGTSNFAQGFQITDTQPGTRLSNTIGGDFDADGDGFDDIFVGNLIPQFQPPTFNEIIYGSATIGSGGGIDLATLPEADRATVTLGSITTAGFNVATESTDFNQDGIDDLLFDVSEYTDPAGDRLGGLAVVFGRANRDDIDLNTLNGSDGFLRTGRDVNGFTRTPQIGDFDGDGVLEIGITTFEAQNTFFASGDIYLFEPQPTGASNLAPVARDDLIPFPRLQTTNGDLLADNGGGVDFDPENGALSVTAIRDANGTLVPVPVNGSTTQTYPVLGTSDSVDLTVFSDGTFTFDPGTSFQGPFQDDTFDLDVEYQLSDGTLTDTATATFSYQAPVNTDPVAVDDAFAATEGTAATFNILAANPTTPDTDPDGDALEVNTVTTLAGTVDILPVRTVDLLFQGQLPSPERVTVEIFRDGTVLFPELPQGLNGLGAGDVATASFDYDVTDGRTGTDTATATITLTGINNAPRAFDDAQTFGLGQVVGNVITRGFGQDVDTDLDPITLTRFEGPNGNLVPIPDGGTETFLYAAPQGGNTEITIGSTGAFTLRPASGFQTAPRNTVYELRLEYEISDGSLTDTAIVDFDLDLSGINRAPVATDDLLEIGTFETRSFDLLADNGNGADSDPDGDAIKIRDVTGRDGVVRPIPEGGSVTVDVEFTQNLSQPTVLPVTIDDAGGVTFEAPRTLPGLAFNATTVTGFDYTLVDTSNATDTATASLAITFDDQPPTAADDSLSFQQETLLFIDVLADNGNGPDQDIGPGFSADLFIPSGPVLLPVNSLSLPSGAIVGRTNFPPIEGVFAVDLSTSNVPGGQQATESFQYLLTAANGLTSVGTVTFSYIGTASIFGTPQADTLVGNNFDQQFVALEENDTVRAGGGDDRIFGDEGEDSLFGEAGNDQIRGGADDDLLDGGPGEDFLRGEGGNDRLLGGPDRGFLFGGPGMDTLIGGDDADRLEGNEDNDDLFGRGGNDSIQGGAGDDTAQGEAGDDTIFGNEGDDELSGGDGTDSLVGDDGNDTLEGGPGDDVLSGGDGNDSILGGDGIDIISDGPGDDFIDGGPGNDQITLTPGGNDTVIKKPGESEDTVIGFVPGEDTYDLSAYGISFEDLILTGGPQGAVVQVGDDTITFQGLSSEDLSEAAFDFGTLDYIDIVSIGRFDRLSGTDANERFILNGGFDIVTSGGGFDIFEFESGRRSILTITDYEKDVDRFFVDGTEVDPFDAPRSFSLGSKTLLLPEEGGVVLIGVLDIG